MTTNISLINLRQPNFEDYLNAKTDKALPFRIRARIINTFERLARGANDPVVSTAAVNILGSEPYVTGKSAPRVRLRRRIPKHIIPKNSSYVNSETVLDIKHIDKMHSSGKGRPTKRKKIALKHIARTIRRFKGGLDDGSQAKL